MKRTIFSLLAIVLLWSATAASPTDSIKARPRAGEIATGAAIGLATNALITELLKHGVSETRPDGSSDNSFPSRHSSWAFAGSTLLSNYLYSYSPWYSLGAQALASAVGAQRIVARRHYASDVIAGAFAGIGSAELGTFIARKIFGRKSVFFSGPAPYNDNCFSIAMETGGLWWLDAYGDIDDPKFCTGYSTALRARFPFADYWSAAVSARGSFTPLKAHGTVYPLSTAGLTAGAAAHFSLGNTALAIEPCIEVGTSYLFSTKNWAHARWSFDALTDMGLSWQITDDFAFRGTVGFHLMASTRVIGAFTLGVSSVATF
ncbi:MAG: phosphatase PAP2 family protein [Muribaculaceae bacterium]|nr:phosphatase PAP2 family protein [Muribaculaceae bacterium]